MKTRTFVSPSLNAMIERRREDGTLPSFLALLRRAPRTITPLQRELLARTLRSVGETEPQARADRFAPTRPRRPQAEDGSS